MPKKDILNNIFNKKIDCSEDKCTDSSSSQFTINSQFSAKEIDMSDTQEANNFPILIPGAPCSPPQKVIINYGDGGGIIEVGNLIQGDNIILTGNTVGRLVGVGDVVIEAVIPPVDLSNYYTKTELQTSGQSQVNWDNLTNVPSIQPPLTFENGLREDGGVVKLGGELTESTSIYTRGNSFLIYNDAGLSGSLGIGPVSSEIGLSSSGTTISRLLFQVIDENILIQLRDYSEKGIVYADDYSAKGTLDPRWIPDWGAVTDYVDNATPDIPTLQEVTDVGSITTNTITARGFIANGRIRVRTDEAGITFDDDIRNYSHLNLRSNIVSHGGHISVLSAGTSGAPTYGSLSTDILTSSRIFTLPDKSGIIALLDDLPPVFTFENGLREDEGVVKLGLDLATVGTSNEGLLTEDTYLVKGDVAGNIFGGVILSDLFSQLTVNTASGVMNIGGTPEEIIIHRSFGGNQSIDFKDSSRSLLIQVTDEINQKGLEEADDYSANKTDYSYVTLKMLQDAAPDLSGYATEQWVLDQNYLSSVGWTDIGGDQNEINLSGFNNDEGFITGVSWTQITGPQSSIEVGNFSNTIGYITNSDIPEVPTSTSQLINDGEDGSNPFITAQDLPDVSGYLQSGDNVSELVNDVGYLTQVVWNQIMGNQSNVEVGGFSNSVGYITSADLPENTSELNNDGEDGINPFITAQDLPDLSDYLQTGDNVSDLVNDAGYLTGVTWGIITGNQSSVEVGDFANTVGYITLAEIPAAVNADWEATSGLAEILNKPSFADVAFSGDYEDLINQPSIPDLTGYATEAWVTSQGYLTSVVWGFDVNTGDLTIDGTTNNLDGRWLERSEGVITEGYGILVSGELATGMGIEVDTDTLDSRYLRKDVNDDNDTFTLTLGGLIAETATVESTLTLPSLGLGDLDAENVLTVDGSGVVKSVPFTMPSFGFTVATGAQSMDIDANDTWTFVGGGDTTITINNASKTMTINSIPGSGTGGVLVSFNGRTDPAAVPVSGDYDTGMVPENGNLYFTQARVRSTSLTGFSAGANTAIVATDSVLQAFGKTQGQINARVPTSRNITVNGTAGNVTVSGGTQNLTANRTWTVNLATVGTAGANKTKVTTDAYGRVTASAALTMGDLPSGVTQSLGWDGTTSTIDISDSNEIIIDSLNATTRPDAAVRNVDSHYFTPFITVSGSATNYPGNQNGAGLYVSRRSTSTSQAGFQIWTNSSNNDVLYYSKFTGEANERPWQTIATREWVTDQIPTVNNGTLTMSTGAGLSGSASFSANQAGNATFAVAAASGYVIPTTTQRDNWNDAFSNYVGVNGSGNYSPSINGDANDLEEVNSIYYLSQTSTNLPTVSGSAGGFVLNLAYSANGGQIYLHRGNDDSLWYRRNTADWYQVASRDWVNSQIPTVPSNFVTTNTNQTGLSGSKGWIGAHLFGANVTINGVLDVNNTVTANNIISSGNLQVTAQTTLNNVVVSGRVTQSLPPTAGSHLANKAYVDGQIPAPQTLSLGSSSGSISISDGNSVSLSSLSRTTVSDFEDFMPVYGLYPTNNTTGSAGYPSTTGAGIRLQRAGSTNNGSFEFWNASSGSATIQYNTGNGDGWNGWEIIASRSWVQSYISGDFVTTNTNQTGLSGNKEWTGSHTFTNSINLRPEGSGGWARALNFRTSDDSDLYQIGGYGGTVAVNYIYVGRSYNDAVLKIHDSGILVGASSGTPPTRLGIDSRIGSLYLPSGNAGSAGVVFGSFGGSSLRTNNGGATLLSGYADTGNISIYLRPNGEGSADGQVSINQSGQVQISGLSGAGSQMIVANAAGTLRREAIPSAQTLSLGSGGGELSISGGNTVNINSLYVKGTVTGPVVDWFNDLPAQSGGFFSTSTGTTGTPNAVGQGIWSRRLSSTLNGSLAFWTANNGNEEIYYTTGSGASLNDWKVIADREWALGNFVGVGGSGGILSSQSLDANSLGNANSFYYLASSSTNLPSVAGSAGGFVINMGFFSASQYGGQMYLQRGVDDGLWFRRHTDTWYQVATRDWVDDNYTITGAASTIVSSNLTANRAVISNGSGKIAVSAVTSTELGYLGGVTSNVQTQLNDRVPTSRQVNSGTGLTGGGNLTANRTLSVVYGTASGTAAQGNDSRINNGQTAYNNFFSVNPSSTNNLSGNTANVDTVTGAGIFNVSTSATGLPWESTSVSSTVINMYGGSSNSAQILLPSGGTGYSGAGIWWRERQSNSWKEIYHSGNLNISNYVPTVRQVSSGDHLSGGGNLSQNRTLTFTPTAGTWMTDSQGNDRMYFGAESNSSSQWIVRASNASGTFQFRDLNNATIFSIGADAGRVRIYDLAGSGNRMVVANSNGELVTQAIPTAPTNYVTTNSAQTGLSGNKSWTGNHGHSGNFAVTGTTTLNSLGVSGTATLSGTTNISDLRVSDSALITSGLLVEGVITSESEADLLSVRLATGTVSGTTINMNSQGLLTLNSISSSTTYTLSNNASGRQVQCHIHNTGGSPVTVSITGARLLGLNSIRAGGRATISIVNFGVETVYGVLSEA